jgi:hypothetical protein
MDANLDTVSVEQVKRLDEKLRQLFKSSPLMALAVILNKSPDLFQQIVDELIKLDEKEGAD